MALTPGAHLGPYEILSALGAGGMGEVYRARDTKLERDVALKILPDAFATDPDRLARFQREAKTLASLNHPNIAAIYGFEEANGVTALVIELVEGEDLAQRIARGRIPLDEALPIAQQIAEALEAAHEQGIIHRDLKPANIKMRPDGTVKVLDFGLAKAMEPAGMTARDRAQSPTITAMTQAGVILGTAAYMSPEQARGKSVDKRTDIWAFGCVVYEMLTARVAFAGETVHDTLAAVLSREPEWSRLPAHTPAAIRRLLRRCLQQDSKQRLHDIADARIELREALTSPGETHTAGARRSPSARLLMASCFAALTAVLGAVAAWNLKPSESPAITRLSQVLPQLVGQSTGGLGRPLVAIAPDGVTVVYSTGNSLYRRRLSSFEAESIRGTEGAPSTPCVSLDSQSVAYWDAAAQELRRVPIAGGTPITLASAASVYGVSWGGDDRILYAQEDGVWRVSANGGTPEQLMKVEATELVYGPRMLPGGDAILVSLVNREAMSGQATAWDQAQVIVHSLHAGERTVIVRGSDARVLPTGHLLYALGTVLLAAPFDSDRRTITGTPVSVIEGVQRMVWGSAGLGGGANYDVSAQGTLAYLAPVTQPYTSDAKLRLLAVGLDGDSQPLLDDERVYWRPRISPDGTRVAVEVPDQRKVSQIWIVDLARRIATPLTSGEENGYPLWTPDGKSIIYWGSHGATRGIYLQAADGGGNPEMLARGDWIPTDVSRDGIVAFYVGIPQDIRTLRMTDKSASDFLVTPAREYMPSFSPDGAWLAYVSNESGQDEIYVRAFPRGPGVARLVSIGGGTAPVWARDGSAVYYRGASGDLMAVPTTLGAAFTAGRPRPLFRFTGAFRPSGTSAAYDIHPDGKRFIMVSADERPIASSPRINVVVNWYEELKRLVPTK